jgi:hypothetical protein
MRSRGVDLKQKTIGEIIESERWLVLAAPERYGEYYRRALDASILLTNFICRALVNRVGAQAGSF